MPVAAAGAPTVTLTGAPGVACSAATANSLVRVCAVHEVAAHTTVAIGTLTGTPPEDIGTGVSTTTAVAAPGNTVTVIWTWVEAVAPTNVTAPYVAPEGQPVVGTTYAATTGTWEGTPTITYGYQWYDCAGVANPVVVAPGVIVFEGIGPCTPIVGANGPTHVLTSCDVGYGLEVVVTATNAVGSTQAVSNAASTSGPILVTPVAGPGTVTPTGPGNCLLPYPTP